MFPILWDRLSKVRLFVPEASLVTLRPLERTDLDLVAGWRQSPEGSSAFFSSEPVTFSGQSLWYDSYLRDKSDMMFLICDADSTPVGTISLVDIDHRNQKAEFGRLLIASSVNRGKGLAMLASKQLLDFGRDQLNLTKIYLYVFGTNSRAIRLYKHLGFQAEGCFAGDIFSEGQWQDVVRMALIFEDNRTGQCLE